MNAAALLGGLMADKNTHDPSVCYDTNPSNVGKMAH
jgi:hypothetical protein